MAPSPTGRRRMDVSVSVPPPTCFWTLCPVPQKTKTLCVLEKKRALGLPSLRDSHSKCCEQALAFRNGPVQAGNSNSMSSSASVGMPRRMPSQLHHYRATHETFEALFFIFFLVCGLSDLYAAASETLCPRAPLRFSVFRFRPPPL